mgnify:CR=1 FL=1
MEKSSTRAAISGSGTRSRSRGWAVDGSPADAVKLGIGEFCGRRPDLVVSGINSGLNAGINVLYSGTVAAAVEGAFFGITSVAVSLEWDEHADYDRAAAIAGHWAWKHHRGSEAAEMHTYVHPAYISAALQSPGPLR